MTPERYARIDRLLDEVVSMAPAERRAYLAGACGADASLAAEVERLAGLADDDHPFLASPALDDLARDLARRTLAGARLGPYEVRERMGGGMSDVYRGHDPRLGRDVVLKLLPPYAAGADAQARLAREARALSALSHPHVLTIFGLESFDGRLCLVTEFVEGRTLREHLADGPLTVETAVAIARQMALALAASHGAGVLHRDIKPENVMVRPDGRVTVLDFGLARAVDAPAGAGPFDTRAGVVLGTPGYMSPEQIRGAALDARSDLFALGVVLYEMLTGQGPFDGSTPADGLAATLTREVAPPRAAGRPLPGPLHDLVMRLLAKAPDARPAGAADVAEALARIDLRSAPHAPPPSRRTWTVALAGALALAVAGGLLAIDRAVPETLDTRDTVVLGPFENTTGEAIFDAGLGRALAAQLEQSPFLSLAADDRVAELLRLMSHPPGTQVTRSSARDLCLRGGFKAYIAGAIDRTGRGYLVTLEAVAAESGAVIARAEADAPSRDVVLAALRQAATRLRARLGETLASVRRFDPPVDRVTTRSLDALRSYALGRDAVVAGREDEAAALLTRATTLDPRFAVAWAQLSAAFANLNNDTRATEAATRAYALRDDVSERERLYIEHRYHRFVDGDIDRAITALELARTLFPRDVATRVNLSSHYLLIGRHDDALREARAALALGPANRAASTNAVSALVSLGRVADATALIAEAVSQGHRQAGADPLTASLAVVEGHAEAADLWAARAAGTPREPDALNSAAAVAATQGRWPEATVLTRRAIDRAMRLDPALAARFAFEGSLRAAAYARCDDARRLAEETVRLDGHAWYLSGAALALALCGDDGDAARLLDRLLAARPRDTLVTLTAGPTIRALAALHRGDAASAESALAHLAPYEAGTYAGLWPAFVRGLAQLRRGGAEEAVRTLQAVAEARPQLLLGTFTPPWPTVELALARAFAAAGRPVEARSAYDRALSGWTQATPGLPEMAAARTERRRLQ